MIVTFLFGAAAAAGCSIPAKTWEYDKKSRDVIIYAEYLHASIKSCDLCIL